MTKKVFLLLFTCLLLGRVNAQTRGFDTVAVSILDKMSKMMAIVTSMMMIRY